MSKKYIILICKSPTDRYQTYVGWDRVYPSRKAAAATLAEAKAKFMAAKLVEVKE